MTRRVSVSSFWTRQGGGAPALNRLAIVALVASTGLMALLKIGDYDIWYHLRAGELFLAHGPLGQLEPFSFTAPTEPMSVQSWLAAVLFHLVHRVSGAGGLVAFNAAVVAATFTLVFLTARLFAREPGDTLLAVLVLTLAAFAVRFRMSVRPHVLEYLLLAATLLVLHRYRHRGKGPLWLLPILQLVWVNVHGSHVLGLALPAIFLAAELLLRVPGLPWRPIERSAVPLPLFARPLGLVVAANLLATLLNPSGHRALLFPFLVAGQTTYMQNINEWQPLRLDLLVGYGARYTWAFTALVGLWLVGTAVRRRRLDPLDLLLFSFFGLLALKGVRLIPEFALATAPAIVRNLAEPARRLAAPRPRAGALLALAVVALAVPGWLLDGNYAFGLGKKDHIFPDDAVRFVEEAKVQGNAFNSFGFGDYLVWRTPDRKVFIHGRNEVFPQALYRRYLDAHDSAATWKGLVDEYGLEYAILEYYLTDYGGKEAMPHLAMDREWVPIYWDRLAIVYVRKGPRNQEVIDRFGYRLIRPTRLDVSYLVDLAGKGRAGEVLAELQRLAAQSPDNEEAQLGQAAVHYSLGVRGRAEAKAALARAQAIDPKRAMTHSAMGLIFLDEGQLDAARHELDIAIALDPEDAAAKHGLEVLRQRR
ncbi:MAG: hypothetical protein ACYC8T_15430 [Myxococcaceae bacterium]